ncbi:MAG: hypothetical protein IAB19_06805 [Proteobacteria bacterium]|uniref:Uncharacterized protein n=1 Tax=Candidatus Avisuccinivibrio stercorigallinarum TaxID=2840704 RepID=A0A9D9DCZ5_9GAMM|nr:hypothetical protein [Candidatus Avisuccinivibrio stercorigallinarum]
MLRHLLLLLAAAPLCAWAAFAPPAPPPELDDDLTSFQTREQKAYHDFIQSGAGGSLIEVTSPAAAGDAAAGVVRLSFNYSGGLTVFVPRYGQTLLRFVDGAGQGLEVQNFVLHSGAFAPELSAAPFELVLRPGRGGAAGSTLAVNLTQSRTPLVFKLVLKAAANDQRAVQSMLYTIRLPQLNAEQILSSEPYPFLQLHPEDKLPDFKIEVSFAQLEDLMLKSLQRIAAGAGESASAGGSSAAESSAAAAGRERH